MGFDPTKCLRVAIPPCEVAHQMLEKLDSALPNKNDDYQEEVIYNFSTASI
jgi:hypothetical protein